MGWKAHRYLFVTATAPGLCDGACAGFLQPPPLLPVGGGHSARCRARCKLWNQRAGQRWNHFVTLLRRLVPRADVAYFKVWELQERGALHAHFLLRLRGVYVPEAVLQRLLVRAGFGFVVKVKKADAGTVKYLTKYLTKSLGVTPGRVWSWSGNWVSGRIEAPYELAVAVGAWIRAKAPNPGTHWRFRGVVWESSG